MHYPDIVGDDAAALRRSYLGTEDRILLVQLVGPTWLRGDGFAPIGISCVAAALQAEGHDVETRVLTPDTVGDVLPRLLWGPRPQMIGIGATVHEAAEARRVSRLFRRHFPAVPIVAGGSCSAAGSGLLAESDIDVIVLGEGEETVCELATMFGTSDGRDRDLSEVRGILFRDGETRVVRTLPRPPANRIEDGAVPVYDQIAGEPGTIRVESSRNGRAFGRAYLERLVAGLIARLDHPARILVLNDADVLAVPDHVARMASLAKSFGLRLRFWADAPAIRAHRAELQADAAAIERIEIAGAQDAVAAGQAIAALADIGVTARLHVTLTDADTTARDLDRRIAKLLSLPAAMREIGLGTRRVRARLPAVAGALCLGRACTQAGAVARAPGTSCLEAVWAFVEATESWARRLTGLCEHAALTDPAAAAPLVSMLEQRLRVLPWIAARAGRQSSPDDMRAWALSEATAYIVRARAVRDRYRAAVAGAPDLEGGISADEQVAKMLQGARRVGA